jgi:hypothetical protein
MSGELSADYKSGSQRARVVTEAWGAENLYCPNCSSPKLNRLVHNTQASDFSCPRCQFYFQLKGQKTRIGNSITDGAYAAMMRALQTDAAPSYYFLHYEIAQDAGRPETSSVAAVYDRRTGSQCQRTGGNTPPPQFPTWIVRNLILVPHFAFPPSAIIKRPPLSSTARRAGWVGCNFALNRIPPDARIEIVRTVTPGRVGQASRLPVGAASSRPFHPAQDARRPETSSVAAVYDRRTGSHNQRTGAPGAPLPFQHPNHIGASTLIIPPEEVRKQFQHIKPLQELPVKERGWTLDVLNVVRRLANEKLKRTKGNGEFTNAEVYAFERELERLHPDNRHVRDKIRQQLQVLRDAGFLNQVERGVWRAK